MSAEDRFPEELLLNEPNRGRRLVQEFCQQYASTRQKPAYYTTMGTQHEEIKRTFYRRWLEVNGHDRQNLGLDVGCRGGVLTKMVGLIRWIGVENDAHEDDDNDADDEDMASPTGVALSQAIRASHLGDSHRPGLAGTPPWP